MEIWEPEKEEITLIYLFVDILFISCKSHAARRASISQLFIFAFEFNSIKFKLNFNQIWFDGRRDATKMTQQGRAISIPVDSGWFRLIPVNSGWSFSSICCHGNEPEKSLMAFPIQLEIESIWIQFKSFNRRRASMALLPETLNRWRWLKLRNLKSEWIQVNFQVWLHHVMHHVNRWCCSCWSYAGVMLRTMGGKRAPRGDSMQMRVTKATPIGRGQCCVPCQWNTSPVDLSVPHCRARQSALVGDTQLHLILLYKFFIWIDFTDL